MTKNKSFIRKIAYLCGIAVLFVPVSLLSAPATSRVEGGGVLSKMRRDYRLSPGQLGKIDPASTAMSLATLGMRGVAATLLWEQANKYKKKDNFDGFKAAANQLAKLQPNFVSVWQFQAWNIAYNISVEFDNFEHRYHWVKKGVDYLVEGTEYNENEPLLLWDAGWFFGHKMGRADEYVQFRRMFRDDVDFHAGLPVNMSEVRGPDSKPDNWLVAHEWFKDAQRAVDTGAQIKRLSSAYAYMEGNKKVVGKKQTAIRGKNPLVFHSDPPKAKINYADAIEEDGYLDEKALLAWRDAGRAWNKYGDRDLVSTTGIKMRLNDREVADREGKEAVKELEELLPGLRQEVSQKRKDNLPPEQAELITKDPSDLTKDDFDTLRKIGYMLQVSHTELAAEAPPEKREEAKRLARIASENEALVDIVDRYREIVNFEYWKSRCEAEQEDNTLEARKLIRKAKAAYDDADLIVARDIYEEAWVRWNDVFKKYPLMIDDVEDVVDYKNLLAQLEESFPPEGFLLNDLLNEYAYEYEIELSPESNEPAPAAETNSEGASEVEPDLPDGVEVEMMSDGPATSEDEAVESATSESESESEVEATLPQ